MPLISIPKDNRSTATACLYYKINFIRPVSFARGKIFKQIEILKP